MTLRLLLFVCFVIPHRIILVLFYPKSSGSIQSQTYSQASDGRSREDGTPVVTTRTADTNPSDSSRALPMEFLQSFLSPISLAVLLVFFLFFQFYFFSISADVLIRPSLSFSPSIYLSLTFENGSNITAGLPNQKKNLPAVVMRMEGIGDPVSLSVSLAGKRDRRRKIKERDNKEQQLK